MAIWFKYLLIAVVGYMLGNISVGIIIAKLYGIKDIRKVGSGNAGSTNVLRNLGWIPSVLTLTGDCLKALLAALFGKVLAGDIGLLIGGTAAMIGHDFPVVFKFKGGKGIASALGMILMINPWLGIALTAVVVATAGVTGYVSLGSVIVCFLYPICIAFLKHGSEHFTAYLVFSILAALLTLFCHRKNIVRLLRHEENKLDFNKISKLKSKIKKHEK